MHSRFFSVAPLIPAENVEQAIAFYRDTLQFTLAFRDAEPAGFAVIERDGVQLNLFASADRHLAQWTSLRIRVDHIDALYEHCRGAGIVHPNGALSERPWGTREFSIIDPSGICIAFLQAA